MYFSGVTLNMISLSGLAIGVGMLVDNSIVSSRRRRTGCRCPGLQQRCSRLCLGRSAGSRRDNGFDADDDLRVRAHSFRSSGMTKDIFLDHWR